mgnify:FL=1
MTKLAVLCSVLASAGVVSGEASATSYRHPLTSASPWINNWFDRNTGAGFLRYDGSTVARYDGHYGIDFWLSVGQVFAGANGTVVYTENTCYDKGHYLYSLECGNRFGNHVRILDPDGKTSVYGHMRRGSVVVAQGSQVSCSQLLGTIGESGEAYGAHLHFEVRNQTWGKSSDVAVDPFAGPAGFGWRSTRVSYWVNQNGGLPTTQCQ